jgi:hypothetical protein
MLRSLATSLAVSALLAGNVTAQVGGSLAPRLGAETEALLRPVLDSAAQDSLPVSALQSKALEGAAKGRPPAEILGVVRGLADRLRQARSVLSGAVPGSPVAAGDIVTAAEAMAGGARPEDIARLRRDAPPGTSLEIPFAVLGELVRRGVPAGQASDVVDHLVQSKVPEARIIEIPARVDVAIRLGAPPVAALGRALHGLGLPVPPSVPPGRGRGRGRG